MRIRVPALVPLLACALLTGCSGDATEETTDARAASATTATPGARTSAAAAPRTGATAVPSQGSSGTPRASAAAQPAATEGPALPGTAAGDYTYDAKGSYSLGGAPQQVEGTATLTVTPLEDNRQRSTLKAEQGETVQDLLVQPDGVHLVRLKSGQPMNKEFMPRPPALLFPTPATVGRSWSWKATSTDRASTVTTTNKVLRTETLTIGGERVRTVVLQSHVVISGDVDYTADVTTWVATAHRLPVKDHTVGKGTWGTLSFSTDVTSVMRSVHPA